jgi:NAD(P)-dependent dehydrogenase (short-subunit alcohol dehydrogenase family)
METKKVLVAGGTGSVGEGIVKTLLQKDWTVVVPGRTKAGLDQLAEYCGHHKNLHLHLNDVSDYSSSARFYQRCRELYSSFDLVIATLGGWRQGTDLLNLSWEEWQQVLNDNLSSHFLTMKNGFQLLAPHGTYIHINGMGADAVIPTAGPVVAAAAAQSKLIYTLAEEQKNNTRKVFELKLGLVNTRKRNVGGAMGKLMINPQLITEYVLYLINTDVTPPRPVQHILKDAGDLITLGIADG